MYASWLNNEFPIQLIIANENIQELYNSMIEPENAPKSNLHDFDELKEGQEATFGVQFTQEMIAQFASLSGDHNSLHTNNDYAKEHGYQGIVVHGCLISSYLSTLVGMYLPGQKSLLMSMSIRWLEPVYVGDRISYRGIISTLTPAMSCCELEVEGSNQNSSRIFRGKLLVKVRE